MSRFYHQLMFHNKTTNCLFIKLLYTCKISGFRLIYAYFEVKEIVVFIQIYHKNDISCEDIVRIKKNFMKKSSLIAIFNLLVLITFAQETPILILGSFHFNFPNQDRVQIAGDNQIDVLEPKYQEEIERLVKLLSEFSPTIIAIERHPSVQKRVDSLYQMYLNGKYELNRAEEEQIGFRLAKKLGIKKIYCVDEWGEFNGKIDNLLKDDSSSNYLNFEKSFYEHPDSVKRFNSEKVFKKEGIIAEFIKLNNEENIKKSLGNYLIEHFKYEAQPYDYIGADFETGRWFNRNLRIFRNVQRIEAKPSDRILLIFGAGHLNILNYLFECSPEYKLENTNTYIDPQ